jgi:hypothetical protein
MVTKKKWVRDVKTVSTFPPAGTFSQDAQTIARIMADPKVSPKGLGSGIRMIQFFINRAGKHLPPERKQELEKAKQLLQARARKQEKKRNTTPLACLEAEHSTSDSIPSHAGTPASASPATPNGSPAL